MPSCKLKGGLQGLGTGCAIPFMVREARTVRRALLPPVVKGMHLPPAPRPCSEAAPRTRERRQARVNGRFSLE